MEGSEIMPLAWETWSDGETVTYRNDSVLCLLSCSVVSDFLQLHGL